MLSISMVIWYVEIDRSHLAVLASGAHPVSIDAFRLENLAGSCWLFLARWNFIAVSIRMGPACRTLSPAGRGSCGLSSSPCVCGWVQDPSSLRRLGRETIMTAAVGPVASAFWAAVTAVGREPETTVLVVGCGLPRMSTTGLSPLSAIWGLAPWTSRGSSSRLRVPASGTLSLSPKPRCRHSSLPLPVLPPLAEQALRLSTSR